MDIYRTMFKGNGLRDKKWHYGGICYTEHWVSIFEVYHEESYGYYDPPYDDIDEIEVDPKTIGQCTGIKDKQNNYIYEYDIVDYKDALYVITLYLNQWCLIPYDDFSAVKNNYEYYIILDSSIGKKVTLDGNYWD